MWTWNRRKKPQIKINATTLTWKPNPKKNLRSQCLELFHVHWHLQMFKRELKKSMRRTAYTRGYSSRLLIYIREMVRPFKKPSNKNHNMKVKQKNIQSQCLELWILCSVHTWRCSKREREKEEKISLWGSETLWRCQRMPSLRSVPGLKMITMGDASGGLRCHYDFRLMHSGWQDTSTSASNSISFAAPFSNNTDAGHFCLSG